MDKSIVSLRKKWTKKAQILLPGHDLQWRYGQLRDFGQAGGGHSVKDVPGVPVIMRNGGKTRTADTLFPKPVYNKPSLRQSVATFIPITQVKELSPAELKFLQSCEITMGYFDSHVGNFVVKKKDQQFRGQGTSACEWEMI